MNSIPVYIINGFLDSGKSEFINYTINAPYFRTDGKTLLIVCEDGEVSYDEEMLYAAKTELVYIDERERFTPEKLSFLEKKTKPERVIIEWNGMWNFKELELPANWQVEQQITNIDGSTFPMYYTNMKSLLAEMLRKSDMIIFNRCDGLDEELASYKRNVKAVNQSADIIFEDSKGEISTIMEDDLPYDLTKDTIELDDGGYGIWYLDSMDHPGRYEGKKLVFKAAVMKPESFSEGYFVPGRMAMTCCADDMAFLGYACRYDKVSELVENEWIQVTATMDVEFLPEYGSEGPVLHALSVEKTTPPENSVISFQ